MNFESGTSLAKFQDKLLDQIQANLNNGKTNNYDKETFRRLSRNMWVKLAKTLAPNNLVVRHYCIQDIIEGVPKHGKIIQDQCDELAPFPGHLWAEGYSYWLYTKKALKLWTSYFVSNVYRAEAINNMIDSTDRAFLKSAYLGKNDLLYPAPFGDLRDIPLEDHLQNKCTTDYFRGKFLTRRVNGVYEIQPYILGGNTHTPVKKQNIKIVDRRPKGFDFYTGYDKKYKNKREEAAGLVKRFFKSIF